MEGKNKAKPVTVSLYPAQIRELEKLEELTGQSKSDLEPLQTYFRLAWVPP